MTNCTPSSDKVIINPSTLKVQYDSGKVMWARLCTCGYVADDYVNDICEWGWPEGEIPEYIWVGTGDIYLCVDSSIWDYIGYDCVIHVENMYVDAYWECDFADGYEIRIALWHSGADKILRIVILRTSDSKILFLSTDSTYDCSVPTTLTNDFSIEDCAGSDPVYGYEIAGYGGAVIFDGWCE